MRSSFLFSALTSVVIVSVSFLGVAAQDPPPPSATDIIYANAIADNIDLSSLDSNLLASAFAEIESVLANAPAANEERRRMLNLARVTGKRQSGPEVIDVHTHAVPSWYKTLVPTTGGNPTPDWTIANHLTFMDGQGIDRAVIAISAPGANLWFNTPITTIAFARILNEQVAAYCRAHPDRLNFYAVVPLPHTAAAITEATYAIQTLGAVGVVALSNFEGMYLGNVALRPFFSALNALGGRQIVYVHPAAPYVKSGAQYIEANPTPYPTGNIEFFFETARTLMDLTLTQTIHDFTNIHYVIPHVGGAFPAAVDRILKSAPAIYDSSFEIYKTRFWWDSAGPTYYHQISGLLGMEVPVSQLLYGTDFPYAPIFTQAGSRLAVANSPLFNATEKTAIFSGNARNLFASKIDFDA